MPTEEARYMWLFVFFDLPVGTKDERRAATQFRKFLLNDGFDMLQWSVYVRLCRGQDMLETRVQRVKRNLPRRGSIRALPVTDRQYARMKILIGESNAHEKAKKTANGQLLLL